MINEFARKRIKQITKETVELEKYNLNTIVSLEGYSKCKENKW